MKILHIITSLDPGGAQIMLRKLLHSSDRQYRDVEVISLMGVGLIGEEIQAMGIPVHSIGMERSRPSPIKIFRVARLIRKISPDVIQTWMYHSDLVGSLAAMLADPRLPVIWGIRHSNLDPHYNNPMTVKIAKLCARLSGYLPKRIICCSKEAKETHQQIGYDPQKIVIIPNGFELDLFRPDAEARLAVRQEIGIAPETVVIGMVARFDPQKDHQNFVFAAGILAQEYPDVEFVLCGGKMDEQNTRLMDWIRQAGVEKKVHLLGLRNDVPKIVTAFDIATLSSLGEAFPNVVGEAMACGVPCVVTDVGDSAMIVGDTGIVTPPQNPLALATGWAELIEAGPEYREKLGNEARNRIKTVFDIKAIAVRYGEVYKEALYGPLSVQWPNE